MRVLKRVGDGGLQASIVCDNGPVVAGKVLDRCAHENGAELPSVSQGRPVEHAHIESSNGKLRDEPLNARRFVSLADARRVIEQQRIAYNEVRPHKNLRRRTPPKAMRALLDQPPSPN